MAIWYSPASYDRHEDQIAIGELLCAPSNALILVEGMFLHREELISFWEASVFLDVPFSESATRLAARNGSNPDRQHASMRRYVEGQRLYFVAARPWERATIVVDNADFTSPRVIHPDMVSTAR